MPSTHLSLHYHLVFGTKARHPWIDPKRRDRLHTYLGGVMREMDGIAEAIGGVADHVHLLAGLKSTHRLADVLRDLKRTSSTANGQTASANAAVHLAIGASAGKGAYTVGPMPHVFEEEAIPQRFVENFWLEKLRCFPCGCKCSRNVSVSNK